MQIGIRHISADTVEWFERACAGGLRSRTSLARELCELEGWRNRRDEPCLASARKALPVLARELDVALPPGVLRGGGHRPAALDYPDRSLRCGLAALGELSLEPVEADGRQRWEAMMATHHPQGWRRSPGGRLLYWIVSSRHGVLGGMCFGASGLQLAPRDKEIGWSVDARIANIGLVVCNRRFLVLPSVRVQKLASRALRLAEARIADDWEAAYGVRPVLAETFTGTDEGTSYEAAGWRLCPEPSSGRRSGVRRSVWLRPLDRTWRKTLRREPDRPLGWSPEPHCAEDGWAAREYCRSRYPDRRVRQRLASMGAKWQERLGAPLPEIFPGKAEQQAAYRLLSNPKVKMQHVLEPHYEATVERCRHERLVLAIQDTTTLNYSGLGSTSGLDNLGGGGKKGTKGVLAHAGVAVNGSGRPLGMFAMDATFRRAPEKDSKRWVAGLGRARELAAACPDSRVVSVCDREGDFWELLAEARESGAALMVRASRSAKRWVVRADGSPEGLWDHVAAAPPLGSRTVDIEACGGRRERRPRTARLTLRCVAVDLVPPKKAGGPPMRMVAVSATEERPPPSVKKPLHWLLLTTEGEPGADTARTALRWYELRWRIERFFHALKNGTRIEDRRLDEADDLRKCLAFDAVTAFRVWDLCWLARTRPNAPVGEYADPDTVHVLQVRASAIGIGAARDPPSDMKTFALLVAGLAGFHPSKRQPMPGTQKLWQGLRILHEAVMTYHALRRFQAQENGE